MSEEIKVLQGKGNFACAVLVDEWLFFSSCNVNGLFKKHIYTGEQIFLTRFDRYKGIGGVHEEAFRVNDALFFFPFGHVEKLVAVYRMNEGTIDYIELPETKYYRGGRLVNGVIDCDDELWIIPSAYDAILRLDKSTYEIEKYCDWPTQNIFSNLGVEKFSSGVKVGDSIYLCPCECNEIVEFNVLTKKMRVFAEVKTGCKYRKIFFYDEKIYLVPEDIRDDLLIYAMDGGLLEKKDIFSQLSNEEGQYRAMCFSSEEVLWMFPHKGEHIIKYDVRNNLTEKIKIGFQERDYWFWEAREYDAKIVVSMGKASSPYLLIEDNVVKSDIVETELGYYLNEIMILSEEKGDLRAGGKIGQEIYDFL